MKTAVKKITPKVILYFYHWLLALSSAVYFGFPSRSMIVIGVTGTKGKTSTAYFIWNALNAAGLKTGIISTVVIGIDPPLALNTLHMTMPGRFALQRHLARMRHEKCEAAIVETTSQGIAQARHKGIDYDILVFTNLTPEHIESHGSFEKYRSEKQKIFSALMESRRKNLTRGRIPKVIIASADTPESIHFLKYSADKKITFGQNEDADIHAAGVEEGEGGIRFFVEDRHISLSLHGVFNAVNALPAIAIGKLLNLNQEKIIDGLEKVASIPGRMEVIIQEPFLVIVDYAYEPASLEAALINARKLVKPRGKVVAVFGAAGGGRDKQKRPIMGKIADEYADIAILTTDDPYEENPITIAGEIASGFTHASQRIRDKRLFEITDRREAIQKALSLARQGDVILILGIGAEQSLVIGNKQIPWDDRMITREEYIKLKKIHA